MTAEWRTLTLRPIELGVFDQWRQVVNLICVQLGQQGNAHPSPTAIVAAISTVVLQAPELAIPDQYRDDVLSGYARCWHPKECGVLFTIPHTGRELAVCGSYSQLERHHSILRSKGNIGHSSERIWLCHTHHHAITTRADGHGWQWLRQALGY